MNFPFFLASRIIFKGHRTFSKLIVRITIGALALAIIAILCAVAILRGFKDEITQKQRGFFSDIIITQQSLNEENTLPLALDQTQIENILNTENVIGVSPFATKVGIMNVNNEIEGVLFKGVEYNYNQNFLQKTLVEGDTLNFDKEQQILISSYLADRLQLKVADDFIMSFVQDNRTRKRKFIVQGIFRTNSEELDKNYVIGGLSVIRKISNLREDEAGAYEIRVKDFNQLSATTEKINDQLPLTMKATNVVEYLADIFNWLQMLDMNDDVIFVLMVIVAIINMISSLLITILERTAMIGILKALGMKNSSVRRVFFYNSIYIIGVGLFIGNVIAIGLYFFQKYTAFFKLDPEIYFIEYVPMSIDVITVVILNFSVVLISLFTLFIPSMLITKISPIKTIQFK